MTTPEQALEQVRMLHWDKRGRCCTCSDITGSPQSWPCYTARILASVDAPAPDEVEVADEGSGVQSVYWPKWREYAADVSPAPPAALPE